MAEIADEPDQHLCLLGFVCRSINLQIFTEISRSFLTQSQDFRCFEVERSVQCSPLLVDQFIWH